MDEAKEALRALIEKVELVPVSAEESETGNPCPAIHLHGTLASLLRLACGLPVHDVVDAAEQMQKAPRVAGRVCAIKSTHQIDAQSQYIDNIGELFLVAGTGFEPVTFRL